MSGQRVRAEPTMPDFLENLCCWLSTDFALCAHHAHLAESAEKFQPSELHDFEALGLVPGPADRVPVFCALQDR